ncbi:hypothetical protein EWM64_g8153 [Hericium alpestre]|uniref:Uncharacterized protein n=1 Tax=Hericium alpestre TaxID=135208 RepID=A0A4Y9ZP75_9AGAM|nr:hypothetical protein EWM64_g8153 [Hericium alpestre]
MQSEPSVSTQLQLAQRRINALERLLSAKEDERQDALGQLGRLSRGLSQQSDAVQWESGYVSEESEPEPLLDLMKTYEDQDKARVVEERKWAINKDQKVEEDDDEVKKMLKTALTEQREARRQKEDVQRVLEDIKSLILSGAAS